MKRLAHRKARQLGHLQESAFFLADEKNSRRKVFRSILENHGLESKARHLSSGFAADAALLDSAGQWALTTDRQAAGRGQNRISQQPFGKDKLVVTAYGVTSRRDFTEEQFRNQLPPSPAKLFIRAPFHADRPFAGIDPDPLIHRLPLE